LLSATRPATKKNETQLSDHGKANEIIYKIGGADHLRNTENKLQSLLYAAGTKLKSMNEIEHEENLSPISGHTSRSWLWMVS